jgi:hypothetical protein
MVSICYLQHHYFYQQKEHIAMLRLLHPLKNITLHINCIGSYSVRLHNIFPYHVLLLLMGLTSQSTAHQRFSAVAVIDSAVRRGSSLGRIHQSHRVQAATLAVAAAVAAAVANVAAAEVEVLAAAEVEVLVAAEEAVLVGAAEAEERVVVAALDFGPVVGTAEVDSATR